jgi:magnesium chelatase subunit D
LDLEHAITEGQRRFEPGLLAQVNRGLLYVDEVNLLDDHLVDLLLDAAAMGVNTVEREGISVSHPARFILVGTMNPEEGELRPQLLDRFGLAVEIAGLNEVAHRVAVIQRRMAYENDAEAFVAQAQAAEQEVATRISAACDMLPQVHVTTADMAMVASLVLELQVDGHRADLTILETARTQAAWSQRTHITAEDMQLAAELALPHRLRRQPFAEVALDEQRLKEALERSAQASSTFDEDDADAEKKNNLDEHASAEQRTVAGSPDSQASSTTPQEGSAAGGSTSGRGGDAAGDQSQQHNENVQASPHEAMRVPRIEGVQDQQQRRAAGRRSRSQTSRKQGRYIASKKVPRVDDIALDATFRQAAPYQSRRRQAGKKQPRLIIYRDDLRQKVRVRRTHNAVCFVVDASWSMAAEERMRATKAAVFSLLRDAYQKRDRVGMVSFQRNYANVLLPLTNSVDLAQKCLQTMPTGGKTPLAQGMLTGFEVLYRARQRDPEVLPLMVLITDGQANVAIGARPPQQEAYRVAEFIATYDIRAVVIDTEHPHFDRGLTRQIATHLQGQYFRLDDINLQGGGLAQMVRAQMKRW